MPVSTPPVFLEGGGFGLFTPFGARMDPTPYFGCTPLSPVLVTAPIVPDWPVSIPTIFTVVAGNSSEFSVSLLLTKQL